MPVFVYGTLRTGQPGYDELGLAARVDSLGPATVSGTLYDLGDYPGAVLTGSGLIAGEMLMPRDDAILPLLDEFELYDPAAPEGSEYLRVRVTLANGATAWIYVYNASLDGATVIASGDWNDRDGHPLPRSSHG